MIGLNETWSQVTPRYHHTFKIYAFPFVLNKAYAFHKLNKLLCLCYVSDLILLVDCHYDKVPRV